MAEEDNGRAQVLTGRDYETQLLGRLWRHPELVRDVMGDITPDHFTVPHHADIYRALVATHTETFPENSAGTRALSDRWSAVDAWLTDAGVPLRALDEVLRDSRLRSADDCVKALTVHDEVRQVVQEHNARTADGASTSLDRAGEAVEKALPPLPAIPPPPAEPPDQPVVVVVAGTEGSGMEAVSLLAHQQLAGRGNVVDLGGAYPPDHPAHQAVRDSRARRPEDRHLAAAQYAIGQRADAVLRTDARDPQALAMDMKRFQEAGYRVEFAAVATPEPIRRINALETHLSDRRTARLPFTLAPDRVGESATRAAAMGADVRVFRPDGTAVDSPGLRSGKRTPAQVIEAERERGLSDEVSMRAVAKAARLAARTTDWVGQEAAREAATAAAGSSTRWNWAIEAAIDRRERRRAPRWGAGRRARDAGPLAAYSDADLQSLLEGSMHRYQRADQEANRAERRREELSNQNKPLEAKAFEDTSHFARETANNYRDTVTDVLTEERRRASLSPRQRQAEIQAVQRRTARVQPPPVQRTAIGFAQPARPRTLLSR
ncbi:zeta toxin family protein [Streptomyces sp. NPDC048636]|uniref:zeta toxin family protein n=1 Tax=Streptomyces sp. NPDC048636 TaxID=3155762 RepID=UPI00343D7148